MEAKEAAGVGGREGTRTKEGREDARARLEATGVQRAKGRKEGGAAKE